MSELIEIDVRRVTDIVETWNIRKIKRNVEPTRGDMTRFIELMNAQTRLLIAEYPASCRYAEFWQDLARQSESACQYTTPGGVVTDHLWRARAIRMVNQFTRQEHEFYNGFMELCINAMTLVTPRARLIVDGIDRTNL